MGRAIDINCDLGEGFGPYVMGNDSAMMDIVTSASVACGFHAGDPGLMADTIALAKEKGIALGAHPGFPDREGFGRRRLPLTTKEIERIVAYQIGALCAIAALVGHRVSHVKIHGALANWAMVDRQVADAVTRASRVVDSSLIALVTTGTELEHAARAAGLQTACEVFADRNFQDDGTLVPRGADGAVIEDPGTASAHVSTMVSESAIITRSGISRPQIIDSVCVHGDTDHAVQIASAVRSQLESDGHVIAPFSQTLN